jgi:hypothetical protein
MALTRPTQYSIPYTGVKTGRETPSQLKARSLIHNEKPIVLLKKLRRRLSKEMPVFPVNKVVEPKTIIGKNGGQRRWRGTRGR